MLTLHHLVADGWSVGVFAQELGALYRAYALEGVPPTIDPLPALVIQYADYALWERRWLTGRLRDQQLDYWKQQLAGAPETSTLPSDQPRPAVQNFEGRSVPVRLDVQLTGALNALSRRHGTTLFMTLLAAWAGLVARLAGQDEVVLGIPVANRNRPELEPLIGFFVNTLALRIDCSGANGGPSVAELLGRVRKITLEAQNHKDVPFDRIVEALRPRRTLSHSPVFQSMLAWENTPQEPLDLGDLHLSAVPSEYRSSQFDLTLNLQEEGGMVVGNLEYASALYERATIERHARQWEAVLRGMAQDETRPIRTIPVLDDAERRQVLLGWNDTKRPYPEACCVHELFERQAEATPDAVAVEHDGRSLTYQQLDERSDMLASRLCAAGVRPDVPVAICARRSFELVAGILAILKAGGAYVPLDPALPAARLRSMVTDCAPRFVLHDGQTGLLFEGLGGPAWSLTEAATWEPLDGREDAGGSAAMAPTADHLAYVMYTSGSTGEPKGVMVEHRSVVNQIAAFADTIGLRARDRVLQFASPSFDASVEEMFATWACGATLVLRTDEWLAAARAFWALCETHAISVVDLPTQFWAQIALERESIPQTVRQVVIGGDSVPETALQAWFECRGHRPSLLNTYGPTETTVEVTTHEIRNPQQDWRTIGRPAANARIYILDECMAPVPIGAPGELYVGGVQVARGYWNRPELTRERFFADPFATEPGERMYKTGDKGRWLADGTIEFLGRHDHQVKIRGFRVELGEVEAHLGRVPGVRAAVVVARGEGGEDGAGIDKRLVAYLVPEAGAALLEPGAVREAMKRELPEYMVPAAYVLLDRLPTTPQGKLDRSALPRPAEASCASREYEVPAGPIESAVAEIWADLLHLERVSRHDHFFELGGHSLLAVQSMSRLRQRLGVDVALAELFAQPVLRSFAEAVRRATPSALPAILPTERPSVLPLSFAQQRLWFLAQTGEAASIAYHMTGGLRLQGPLDTSALKEALDRIVKRHEVLRTRFEVVDGLPAQRISPDGQLAWSSHDLAASADPSREVARHALLEAEAPFDLTAGSLFRGRLLRLGADEHVLLLTLHHIVGDGWSLGVLARELGALYRAYALDGVTPTQDPLPPLPVQYADYALWERRWLSGGLERSQLDYWKRQLDGAPRLTALATDHPRPAVQDYAGQSLPVMLEGDLVRELKALSQRHGVTLFMTLLAAWGALASRLSGQDEVVIGTPVANRARPEVEPLIGFFVNTLALRVDVSEHPSVRELLARVRRCTLEAQDHKEVPFERVVEALQPERTLAHSPLVQLMLAWQNAPDEPLDMGELRLRTAALDEHPSAPFDLTLSLQEQDETISGSLVYATALYERDTIERHLSCWRAILQGMVRDDTQCVDAIDMLSEKERQVLLTDWNDTARPVPQSCVHELFEAQAVRTPDAAAVVHGDSTLSYRDLNQQATRLSRRLLAAGVKPGRAVAIVLERSIPLVVAQIAILKCGAFYVPLEPNVPMERQLFILKDCDPSLILAAPGHELPSPLGIPCISLGAHDEDLERASTSSWEDTAGDAVDIPVARDATAYVMYTSGSTGKPKGVVVPHRAIVRVVCNNGYASFEGGERVAFASNAAFDAATMEVWAPLLHGGCLVVVDAADLLSPERFAVVLNDRKVTTLFMTSALLRQYAQEIPQALAGLRYLMSGGDRSDPRAWARVLAEGGPEHFIHCYGPTETTTFATTCEISRVDAEAIHLPIGRPITGTSVYVLDRHGAPVPLGVAGEIYIGGEGVANGYLNRPDLTRERFVPDPFAAGPATTMYRTGDVGRWRADGTLEFIGRNDRQVKIRGFRVEVGEIEAHLARMPGVHAVEVLAREDRPGEKQLVAYLVGDPCDPGTLRSALTRELPEYMVPAAFVFLDRFPLTANGKVNRNALPAPEGAAHVRRDYEAPLGPIESALATLWAELLRVERVGRHDHFFELGGHSLLVTQMVDRARRSGLQIDIKDLFDSPTVAGLAGAVKAAPGANSDRARNLMPIRTSGTRRPLFLIHEGFGGLLAYERLARFLETGIPMYGLEASALHEEAPAYRSVEAMAAEYSRIIKTVQPEGPYRLAGWSGGGLIAYEVAYQMIGANEVVEFVGMMDTYHLADAQLPMEQAEPEAYLIRILEYLKPDLDSDELRSLWEMGHLEAMVEHGHRMGWVPSTLTNHEVRRRCAVANHLTHACLRYFPPTLPVDVHLFAAEQPSREDMTNGWRSVLGPRLEAKTLDGTHMSIMQRDTSIREIADRMSARLSEVEKRARECPPTAPQRGLAPLSLQHGRGECPPVFCFPGAGANVTAFAGLVQALDPRVPVYGVQPLGLDGVSVPHAGVEAAARQWLSSIRAAVPGGPYRLIGHSFGGWIALEVARQLRRAGLPVDPVVVVDSEAPATLAANHRGLDRAQVLDRLIEVLEQEAQQSLSLRGDALAAKNEASQLKELRAAMVRAGLLPAQVHDRSLLGMLRVFSVNVNTGYALPEPFEGAVLLVQAGDELASDQKGRSGLARATALAQRAERWRSRVSKLDVRIIPGNHMSMLRLPHVRHVASLLHEAWGLPDASSARDSHHGNPGPTTSLRNVGASSSRED